MTNRRGMSRRDLLAGAVAFPVAFATGCGGPAAAKIDGEILGASEKIGHRLRDGFRPTPKDTAWRHVSVVIVGGGIAGLSAAWRLKRAGFNDFVLLELEPVAGGTSRGGELKGIPCPWGAHYLPVPMASNRPLVALLKEMNVVESEDAEGEPRIAEQYLCRDPEERLFFNGAWREGLIPELSADDQQQMNSFHAEVDRWVQWRDARGRRAFTIPVANCSDDPEVTRLDRQTMGAWLDERNLRSPRLRWLIDYACRDDYGMTVDQTSAWAGLFYYASRVRRSGDEAQPLITWPEGNGRLAAHLIDAVREHVRSGLAVTEVVSREVDGVQTIEVVAVGSDGSSVEGFRTDRVIFAAPQFLAPYLVRGYRDSRGQDASEFQYGAWLVANLYLKQRPAGRDFPLAWDNVIYDSPSLGYVTATHQSGRDHGPTVFTYYLPLCDDDPKQARERLLQDGWSVWCDRILRDLEQAHPELRSIVERVDVMRWGHAMIRPRPGFIWGTARTAAAKPFGSIHFAHSDLSGVALFEEAFYHGHRAAEEVLTARDHRIGTAL
ncbi:MAG: FAD-dependent oxidoreductase [Planctomycetaceae bacterium]